jgi:hypothetical protein
LRAKYRLSILVQPSAHEALEVILGFALSKRTRQWIQQTPTGVKPSPRAFAGFARSCTDLYLFAGLGQEKKVLRDLWTYSLDFSTWTSLAVEVPSNRFGMQLITLTQHRHICGWRRDIRRDEDLQTTCTQDCVGAS